MTGRAASPDRRSPAVDCGGAGGGRRVAGDGGQTLEQTRLGSGGLRIQLGDVGASDAEKHRPFKRSKRQVLISTCNQERIPLDCDIPPINFGAW